MPRILSVLATFAVLALATIAPVAAYPSRSHHPSTKLSNELQSERLQHLENKLEHITQLLEDVSAKIDLSGDERNGNVEACPLAALYGAGEGEQFNEEDEEDEAGADEADAAPALKKKVGAKVAHGTAASHAAGRAAGHAAAGKTAGHRNLPRASYGSGGSSGASNTGAASDKLAAVWQKVTADSTPGSFPPGIGIFKLLLEDMAPTDDWVSEVMPAGRVKYIHSVGAIAQGSLTWSKALPFTGLFKTGSSKLLIRLSSAKDPANTAVTAGISLKAFRDNAPSANSFFLNAFSSDSWNFFDRTLQNHVTSVLSEFDPAKILLKKFQTTSMYAFYTGLSDWARTDEAGNVTPDAQIKFPFQMIMVPNPTVRTAGAAFKPDGKIFTNQFANIQPGTSIYTVYLQDEPLSTPYQAGLLTLANGPNGKLVTSNYGDNTLFFKHQRFEEDFALRPDWKTKCPKPESCEFMYKQ